MATNAQPIAGTLDGQDLRDRRARIADLAREGMLTHQRGDLALRLRYKPDVLGRVRQMVRQEEAYCAFLTFELHQQADEVILII